jgi:hypothetical protein
MSGLDGTTAVAPPATFHFFRKLPKVSKKFRPGFQKVPQTSISFQKLHRKPRLVKVLRLNRRLNASKISL